MTGIEVRGAGFQLGYATNLRRVGPLFEILKVWWPQRAGGMHGACYS
jgi:hypothetical protein